MNKLYDKIIWNNNTTPALNETNLNKMSKAIDDIDDRVVELAADIFVSIPQIQAYLDQAEDLYEAMVLLSQNPPYIGQNGNWWVWSTSAGAFVDSGFDASITVQIADISMLEPGATPYVTNTGTNTDPVFHLFIPRGQKGADGDDGVSPAVTITTITGGHRVTITDADHPSGQSFDVMDGQSGASAWDDITNKPFNDVSDDPGDGLYIQNDTLKAYANQRVNIHDNTSSAAAANRAKWELITLSSMGTQSDDYVLPGSWYMQQSITLSVSQDTVATFNGYTIDNEGNERYYINTGMALQVWTGTDDDDTRDYPYKSLEIDGTNHECNITFPPYTGAGNPPTIIVKITQ